MLDYIFLDLDNTVYDYKICNDRAMQAVFSYLAKQTGISSDILQKEFFEARKSVKQQQGFSASSHSRLLYFQALNERLFASSNIEECLILHNNYWTHYFGAMSIFPFVQQFLEIVKSHNSKVVIATNFTADIQFRKLSALGLAGLVDILVSSEEAGFEKPADEFTDYLCLKAGFRRDIHSSWFIGDDMETDYKTGLALGSEVFIRGHRKTTVADNCKFFQSFRSLIGMFEREMI